MSITRRNPNEDQRASLAPATGSAAGLVARINEYLQLGGLFNPEMMEHDKVRDLLIDCRECLQTHQPKNKAMLTKEQLAQQLNGRQIGEEMTQADEAAAEAAGLVVVFGASDDLMEFRGAIGDECGAWGGHTALIDKEGLLPDRDNIDDDDELERFFIRKRGQFATIEAIWCKEKGYSWMFKTDLPHVTFEILEKNEHFCKGIIFHVGDLP